MGRDIDLPGNNGGDNPSGNGIPRRKRSAVWREEIHPPTTFGIVASICLYLVIGGCILGLLFFVFTNATSWGRGNLWEKVYEDFTVRSRVVKIPGTDKGLPIMQGDKGFTVTLFWWWCAPLVAIVASIAVLCIPERRSVMQPFAFIKRVLCTEIPSDFLEKQCDGMTIGELSLILLWLGINATLFQNIVRIKVGNFDAVHQATGEPIWALRFDAAGFALGICSFLNFGWVMFPISRHSPLFDVLGLSFEKRIRYHRWLSMFALFLVSTHGMIYWLMWIIRGQWVEKALDWEGPLASNLSGAIALGCGLAMWVTALSFFRRHYFEIFYRTHLIGFVGFIVFAQLHVPFYIYMSAGLLMYVVDIVLRTSQLSLPVAIQSSETNSDGTITTIRMKAPKGLNTNSVPTIWVSCPDLSICQWHPVTPTISNDGYLRFSLKSYGKWTKALATMNKTGELTSLKVEGPHDICMDGFYAEMIKSNCLVFCAGGIAITPILSMLRVLEEGFQRNNKGEYPPANSSKLFPSVRIFWVVRNAAELEVGSTALVEFERKYPDKVSIEIYVTSSKDKKPSEGTRRPPMTGLRRILHSLLARNPSPILLPSHRGPLHLAFLYIVSYCAGFAGLLLGNAWRLERLRSAGTPLANWKNSIVIFLCIMTMSIGWVTLMVLPFQFVMLFKVEKSKRRSMKSIKKTDPSSTSEKTDQALSQQSATTNLLERSHHGRPNFHDLLAQIESRSKVSVLASGPDPLISSVKKACDLLGFSSFSKAAFSL